MEQTTMSQSRGEKHSVINHTKVEAIGSKRGKTKKHHTSGRSQKRKVKDSLLFQNYIQEGEAQSSGPGIKRTGTLDLGKQAGTGVVGRVREKGAVKKTANKTKGQAERA